MDETRAWYESRSWDIQASLEQAQRAGLQCEFMVTVRQPDGESIGILTDRVESTLARLVHLSMSMMDGKRDVA